MQVQALPSHAGYWPRKTHLCSESAEIRFRKETTQAWICCSSISQNPGIAGILKNQESWRMGRRESFKRTPTPVYPAYFLPLTSFVWHFLCKCIQSPWNTIIVSGHRQGTSWRRLSVGRNKPAQPGGVSLSFSPLMRKVRQKMNI